MIAGRSAVDTLIGALQEQIGVANELGLDLVVRVLRMAVLEVRLNASQVSQEEIEELCLCLETGAVALDRRPAAEVISLAEVRGAKRR